MRREVLFICFLTAISLASGRETEYKKGEGYHYDYSAYILSGAPDYSSSYAGFILTTHLHIHYIKDVAQGRLFTLHLINPRIKQFAGDVSPLSAERQDPPKKFINLKGGKTFSRLSKKELERPVEFIWSVDGSVLSINASPKEKLPALNIKRGLLSAFSGPFGQISTSKRFGIFGGSFSDVVEGKCGTSSLYYKTRGTSYKLNSYKDNYNCSIFPTLTQSSFNQAYLNPCTGKKGYRVSSDIDIDVDLQRKNSVTFFIDGITIKARYGSVNTPKAVREDLVTFVNQEIKFISRTMMKVRKPLKGYKTRSVIMEIPKPPKPFKTEKEFFNQIKYILLTMQFNPGTAKFQTNQYIMVILLQRATAKQIRSLLNKRLKYKKKLRFTILTLLANSGTDDSIKVLIEELKNPKVSDKDAAMLAAGSAITSSTPKKLAGQYRKLLLTKVFETKKRKETFKAVIRGIGSLVSNFPPSKVDALAKSIKAWFNKLKAADLSKLMSDETKLVTLLAGVGNTGFKQLSPILKKYLKKGNSLTVRLAAQRAWRKLIYKAYLDTILTMYPIFADPTEDAELRINAFVLMYMSNPPSIHMAYFAQVLRRENDENLINYVVSTAMSVMKAKDNSPCWTTLKSNARRLLSLLPRSYQEIDKTNAHMTIKRIDRANYVLTSVIFTKDSVLPRSVSFVQTYVDGNKLVDTFEIQITSLGSQNTLRRMLEKLDGYAAAMKSGSAYLRTKRSAKAKQTDRMSIRLTSFGEDYMEYAGKNGKMMAGAMKNFNRYTNTYIQDIYQQPTTIGIPLVRDRIMTWTYDMKLSNKMEVTGDKKLKINTLAKTSGIDMIEGVMGSMLGEGVSVMMHDLIRNSMPGGKSSFKVKTTLGRGSLSTEASLLPLGKAHKIYKEQRNAYLFVVDGSNYIKRVEMKYFRKPKVITTTSGKMRGMPGMPIQNKKSKTSTGASIPYLSEMTIMKGSTVGFALDIKTENLKTPTSSYSQFAGTTKKEALKRVRMFFNGGTPVYEYPMGALLPPIKRKKKFTITVSTLVLQNKKVKKTTAMTTVATLQMKADSSSSLYMKIMNAKKAILFTVIASVKNIGPPVYFNPSNPFEITTGVKRVRNIKLKAAGRATVFSLSAISSMSRKWVTEWKTLLRSPQKLDRNFPFISKCFFDGLKNRDYSNSPNCIRTFETLQQFDTHRFSLISAKPLNFKSANFEALKKYFTDYTVNQKTPGRIYLTATIDPTDANGVRHLQTHADIRDGVITRTCDVGIYRGKRRVIVNSFDTFYSDSYVSSRLFSGKNSLVIAQDRVKNDFTVAFSYKGLPTTVLTYRLNGKTCTIKMQSKQGELDLNSDGLGCFANGRDTYKTFDDAYFLDDSITIFVRQKMIILTTKPGKYARIRLGLRYFNSVRGICGNIGEQKNKPILVGKSCKRKLFYSKTLFVNDYIVKNPTGIQKCS